MNRIVALCVCALIAVVSCQELLPEFKKQCIQESGATEKMVSNVYVGIFSDKPELAKFLVCAGKRGGILDDNGHVKKDALKKQFMTITADEAKIDAAMEKCVVDKATTEETVLESTKCMFAEVKK